MHTPLRLVLNVPKIIIFVLKNLFSNSPNKMTLVYVFGWNNYFTKRLWRKISEIVNRFNEPFRIRYRAKRPAFWQLASWVASGAAKSQLTCAVGATFSWRMWVQKRYVRKMFNCKLCFKQMLFFIWFFNFFLESNLLEHK